MPALDRTELFKVSLLLSAECMYWLCYFAFMAPTPPISHPYLRGLIWGGGGESCSTYVCLQFGRDKDGYHMPHYKQILQDMGMDEGWVAGIISACSWMIPPAEIQGLGWLSGPVCVSNGAFGVTRCRQQST